MSTLTPNQQKVLKWLVELKNNNHIKENFIVNWNGNDNAVIDDEIKAIPELVKGALDAICSEKLLICQPVLIDESKMMSSRYGSPYKEPIESFRRCTFTGKALELAKNNFLLPEPNNAELSSKYSIIINKQGLRQVIQHIFNENEFRTMCFDLGVNVENFESRALNMMIIEFIDHMARDNALKVLIKYIDETKHLDATQLKAIII